jgi:DNA-binding NtrC family response regulator
MELGTFHRLYWSDLPLCKSGLEEQVKGPLKKDRHFIQSARVLVIDDDEGLRWSLVAWLNSTFDVLEARDGKEAWSLLVNSSGAPVVVLTDNQMPGMTGTELLYRIRREGIPILGAILMSGDAGIQLESAKLQEKFASQDVPLFVLSKVHLYDALAACLEQIVKPRCEIGSQ